MNKCIIVTKQNNIINVKLYNCSLNDFKEMDNYINDNIIYFKDIKPGFTLNMLGEIYPNIKTQNPSWENEIILKDDITSITFIDEHINSSYLIEHLDNIFENWI